MSIVDWKEETGPSVGVREMEASPNPWRNDLTIDMKMKSKLRRQMKESCPIEMETLKDQMEILRRINQNS